MYNEFVSRLASRLAQPLPGEDVQYLVAPVGRARAAKYLSSGIEYRNSSVLVLLYPRNEKMHTVLLKRHDYQGVHSGQVGFPGGKQEPGESLQDTALREANEEIGLDAGSVQVIGQLTNLYIPVSRFAVHPFVAVSPVRPGFIPDPYEVQQLIEVDLDRLSDASTLVKGIIKHSNGMELETPYYNVEGFTVWGATAMIISEFLKVLQESGSV